jgi:hypothetical protein
MTQERDFAVNAKVSSAAASRLKKLSLRRGQSYGEVLDALLLDVPVEAAEWEAPIEAMRARIESLEVQISTLLSTAGLERTGSDLSGFDGQGLSESGVTAKAPEIAVEAAISASTNKPIKIFIADLVATGERSPARIARALNGAGYRTGTGTEFQRSNPQIAGALKGT